MKNGVSNFEQSKQENVQFGQFLILIVAWCICDCELVLSASALANSYECLQH